MINLLNTYKIRSVTLRERIVRNFLRVQIFGVLESSTSVYIFFRKKVLLRMVFLFQTIFRQLYTKGSRAKMYIYIYIFFFF